ncbi:MAG: hypothetical protein E6G53_10305 [Actinobacteria bacterium]|nr:MAG: hypothetical protein E6G53_10305 [Actinomycetota bacterium]
MQYTIGTDRPAHWVCTDPAASCDHVLTPQSGDGDVQNLDFGGYTAAHLTIREVFDSGSDPGRFDISVDGTVELAGAGNGDSVQQSVTGGSHSVSQSESGGSGGSYDVQLECRADGGTGDVVPAPNGDVTLAPGDDVVCTFRVAQRPSAASVSGVVFNDNDGDGAAREAGEPPVDGAQIWVDLNGNGKQDSGEPQAITAADGSYSIAGLAAGHYVLRKAPRDGWTCTYPSGCSQAVDLSAAQAKTGVDFGDHQNPDPPHACGSGVIVPAGSQCPHNPPPPGKACLKRPVVTWVAGHHISRVAFYLDGKRVHVVRRANRQQRWEARFDRTKLSAGRHVVRAQVFFTTRGRKPMSLHFVIRSCLTAKASKAIQTTPRVPARCVSSRFRAYVKGDTIRRVVFYLDGHQLKSTNVADWQGHYWVEIDASKLTRDRHDLRARMDFIRASGQKSRTLELRFRRCGP